MNARLMLDPADVVVHELDGPPMAYFEIPLDHFATPNGEMESESHPDAARLTQRVVYINFKVLDNARVQTILTRINAKLREIGGGFIWWRRRPHATEDMYIWLRLGTTPALPDAWWQALSRDVGNGDLGQNVPGVC